MARTVCVALTVFLAAALEAQETHPYRFTGVVQNAAGEPSGNALVLVLPFDDKGWTDLSHPLLEAGFPHRLSEQSGEGPVATLRTDSEGRFACVVPLPANLHVLGHRGDNGVWAPLQFAAFTPNLTSTVWFPGGFVPRGKDEAKPMRLIVYPRARLLVRVTDAQGTPIANERVLVSETSFLLRTARVEELQPPASTIWSDSVSWERRTNHEGVAAFQPPAGIDLRVRVRRLGLSTLGEEVHVGQGFPGAWAAHAIEARGALPQPLRLAAGETHNLTMTQPRLVRVRGRVLDRQGSPVNARLRYAGTFPLWKGTIYDPSVSLGTKGGGRFAFPKPLPVGGFFSIMPEEGGGTTTTRLDPDAQDDPVSIDIRLRPETFRVHVEGTEAQPMLVAARTVQFPKSVQGRTFTFSRWIEPEQDVLVAASGQRIGFHLTKKVPTLTGETKIEVPPFALDASLELQLHQPDANPLDGTIYLACTDVDHLPGTRVFAEIALPAEKKVTLPELQAGHYLLGFIPREPHAALFQEAGKPVPSDAPHTYEVMGIWHRTFGTLTHIRKNAWWRPLHLHPGKNRVTLDLTKPTTGGVLEIVPVGRNGSVLKEFYAGVTARPMEVCTGNRHGRVVFPADKGGVIRITDMPPGLYLLSVLAALPGELVAVDQPTVIPSDGTWRIEVRFNLSGPDKPVIPLMHDRVLGRPFPPSKADGSR